MEKEKFNNERKYEQTVFIHREMVKKAAKKYLGKHFAEWVDDITQDVMLKALMKFDSFDNSKGTLAAWMFTITRNLCFDLMAKKANSLNKLQIDESFLLVCEDEKPYELKELRKIIGGAMGKLSERDKSLLMLRYYYDYSGREIGIFIGIPENQVAGNILRAKDRLKRILDRDFRFD